jgi:hypothetical protein
VPVTDVLSEWRVVASIDVEIPEISGLVLLGGRDERALLVVSDQSRWVVRPHGPEARPMGFIEGALFVLRLRVKSDGLEVTSIEPLPIIDEYGLVPRVDPRWGEHGNPFDLEAITPLGSDVRPYYEPHFLLSGEANPEDASDDGANRLYVVRWARDRDRAHLQAFLPLPDLPDDGRNDRWEGLVAISGPVWSVWAFKERTTMPRPLGHELVSLSAEPRSKPPWEEWSARIWRGAWDRPRPPPRRLGRAFTDVLSQTDACTGPGGEVWVLDRWQRRIHRCRVVEGLRLERFAAIDLLTAVRDVPGEQTRLEPPPFGIEGGHGVGRHEGLALGTDGWLWLVADRGPSTPSRLTVLAPREAAAEEAPAEAAPVR